MKRVTEVDNNHRKKMESYYSDNHYFFKMFWTNKTNLSLHMGFWDSHTKNLHEALMAESAAMLELLDINSSDYVLDVGCGLGGTAILAAEHTGARVMGVDIVDLHIAKAKKHASRRKVEHETDFVLGDCTALEFSSGVFDKAYALESMACMPDKRLVVRELARVLKSGGSLGIIDYFVGRNGLNQEEEELVRDWSESWSMANLYDVSGFSELLKSEGYNNIKFVDTTEKVMPSVKKINKTSLRFYPFMKLAYFLKISGMLPDKEIFKKEIHMFEKGLIKHGVFMCKKGQ